jgi:hypothetical protein
MTHAKPSNHGKTDSRDRIGPMPADHTATDVHGRVGEKADPASSAPGSGDRGPEKPRAADNSLTALYSLREAGWITPEQYEVGLMFGDLWRHEDRHYVALRNEIMVDLVKTDVLDLVCRVCRDNRATAAFDRIADLRVGLNLIGLRFWQIEKAAGVLPEPRTRSRRHAGRALLGPSEP